jgi:PKD repeat protein
MKSVRVVLVVVGLLALPLVAAAAQGQSAANKCKNTPQAGQNGNSQRGAAAVAQAQANKCPAPVTAPPNLPPAASFTSICSELSCSFTSASTDPDGTISAYSWTFGDGGTSSVQNPSHSYGAAGSYSVTLTVTDNQGAPSGPQSQTVNVTSPSQPPPSQPPPALANNEIHGMVWEDLDAGDGVRDPFAGEMGLAGWSVQLFDANGLLLNSATTDDAGNYVFAALPAGTYSVCVVGQPAYHQTAPLSGSGCGGLGYRFAIQDSRSGSWTVKIDFGQMLN